MSHRRKGKQMEEERPSPDHVSFTPDPPFWQRISATGWLLLGLALGLVGSLYYAWVIDPVIFTDASPARFNNRYRAEYIVLVSQSYAVNGDWSLVQSRLAALEDPNVSQTVNALLEQYVREQRPAPLLRNLAIMAQGLGAQGQAIALFAPTPLPDNLAPTPTPAIVVTPAVTPTVTPTPTETAIASTTPTATSPATTTPQPNFRLLNQERVCDPEGDAPRIEVITVDAFLNDLPGVEVLVTWQGGSDRFFTGFKPAQGEGYGDFTMSPDVSYSVRLADGSPEVSGLRLEPCESSFDGGWQLTFQNLRFGATATPESRE